MSWTPCKLKEEEEQQLRAPIKRFVASSSDEESWASFDSNDLQTLMILQDDWPSVLWPARDQSRSYAYK